MFSKIILVSGAFIHLLYQEHNDVNKLRFVCVLTREFVHAYFNVKNRIFDSLGLGREAAVKKPALLALILSLIILMPFGETNSVFARKAIESDSYGAKLANSTGDIDIRSGTFTALFEQSKKYTVGIVANGSGLGSGLVWTKDGYILTGAHVIGGKKEIRVYVTEKKYYSADVVGEPDTEQDVAVLKIKEKVSLTPAPIGDSDSVRSGEWVYAIGNPFGLYQTVTVGVVSGLHRNVRAGIQEVIQTDAAINPGNSGGPLYNVSGAVIGMNVMIYPDANTTGFAIPINDVIYSAKEILKKGKVTYASLGIQMLDLSWITDEDSAKKNGIPWPLLKTEGVVVMSVVPGGPAFAAGLKQGDIILSFNGVDVYDSVQLSRLVARSPVGVPLGIAVERSGSKVTLFAVLQERAMNTLKNGGSDNENGGSSDPKLNFGPALSLLPVPVKAAIQKYQGMVSEASVDFAGNVTYRFTNGFLVDKEHVLSVSSFVNTDAKHAFEATYFFNVEYPARLVYIDPRFGLSLFRLEKPYPGFDSRLKFSQEVKIGVNYYSLVAKNLLIGNSTPYSVTLLNIAGPLLAFPALLKPVGLGAPIFSQEGEVVGVWLSNDWDRSDPKDVPDVAYALPSSVVLTFIEVAKSALENKEAEK